MAVVGKIGDIAGFFAAPALQPVLSYLRAVSAPKSPESTRILAMEQNTEYKFGLESCGDFGNPDSRVFAIEQSYGLKSSSQAFYETHRAYVDVQIILQGQELFHLASARDCEILVPYDECRDLVIYRTPEKHSVLHLYSNMVAVFFPEDVHAGGLGLEQLESQIVYKSVVKVPRLLFGF